jgi:hypothetical protein
MYYSRPPLACTPIRPTYASIPHVSACRPLPQLMYHFHSCPPLACAPIHLTYVSVSHVSTRRLLPALPQLMYHFLARFLRSLDLCIIFSHVSARCWPASLSNPTYVSVSHVSARHSLPALPQLQVMYHLLACCHPPLACAPTQTPTYVSVSHVSVCRCAPTIQTSTNVSFW